MSDQAPSEIEVTAREGLPSDGRLEPEGTATAPAVLVLNAKARSGRERGPRGRGGAPRGGRRGVEVISPKRPAEILRPVKAALRARARRVSSAAAMAR